VEIPIVSGPDDPPDIKEPKEPPKPDKDPPPGDPFWEWGEEKDPYKIEETELPVPAGGSSVFP